MEKSVALDAVSDMLVFATLIKEKKPVILYYNTYKFFFDGMPPNDTELARVISLAQLTEVKIIVQKHPMIEDDDNFWRAVNNFYLLLLSISSPLGLVAIIDWCHQITEKTCIITLKPGA